MHSWLSFKLCLRLRITKMVNRTLILRCRNIYRTSEIYSQSQSPHSHILLVSVGYFLLVIMYICVSRVEFSCFRSIKSESSSIECDSCIYSD
jgi:hypothetical protein